MTDSVSEEIARRAQAIFDAWFDKLWTSKRLEIEVRRDLWSCAGRRVEGFYLFAPFGLGGERTEWRIAVRERDLTTSGWRSLRSITSAEADLVEVLTTAWTRPPAR